MKILVVCQHYWPEPYPLTEMCEELVRRGHEVHIVTDIPNYPQGEIYDGYGFGKLREEEHNGVRIFRAFTIPRKHNPFFRVLNYYSYSFFSSHLVKKLPGDYDVVFTNQTSPIMMVAAAMAYARKWNKKTLLYCMDLWPASLSVGGISRGPVYQHYLRVSQKYYGMADRIVGTSRMFAKYFEQVIGIPASRIGYIPQFADDSLRMAASPRHGSDEFRLVFAGNIGVAQSVDTILKAAAILQHKETERRIIIEIVGDGSEYENMKRLKDELQLDNVHFTGRLPKEQMPEVYGEADAMLVTLIRDEFVSYTLPAKVQSYMAAGKPIIAAADGEIPTVISESRCGICVPAEDHVSLAEAILNMSENSDIEQMGNRARQYYDSHFAKLIVAAQLEEELQKLAASK
ncbi:MAG: glycosyltransferase family 4 protein [Erysipelotrichaceae bacterium]|nr:glycosyltransferase family 4 protein [Erysipelotrichaceae bacterium]